ncbi:MFS transporter [Candidatus Bathyarchaeota archaeon]|nr:MFS transporter [Candidatus Bathyarchaeota archaeon]
MTEKSQPSNKRNIKILTVRSLLYGVFQRIFMVIRQPFILSLNPSVAVMGFLEGLGGFQGLIPAIIQPFFGWLSDRMQRKPFIILGSILMEFSLILFFISGLTSTFFFIIPAVILSAASLLTMPIIDSLIAESVETSKRSRAYNKIMLAAMAPGIFSPFIGGILADRFGFISVLAIGIVIQLLIIFLLFIFLKEGPFEKRAINFSELRSFITRNLSPPRNVRNLYLMNGIDALSVGLGPGILYGLLRSNFGFSISQLGMLSTVNAISMVITQLIISRRITNYRIKKLLLLANVGYLIYVGGAAVSNNFWVFLLLEIVMGIAPALWVPAHKTLLANSVTKKERAEAMGRVTLYRGIFGFPAPFIGGILYEQFGYSVPLWGCFILGIVGTYYIYFHIHVKDNRLIEQ